MLSLRALAKAHIAPPGCLLLTWVRRCCCSLSSFSWCRSRTCSCCCCSCTCCAITLSFSGYMWASSERTWRQSSWLRGRAQTKSWSLRVLRASGLLRSASPCSTLYKAGHSHLIQTLAGACHLREENRGKDQSPTARPTLTHLSFHGFLHAMLPPSNLKRLCPCCSLCLEYPSLLSAWLTVKLDNSPSPNLGSSHFERKAMTQPRSPSQCPHFLHNFYQSYIFTV